MKVFRIISARVGYKDLHLTLSSAPLRGKPEQSGSYTRFSHLQSQVFVLLVRQQAEDDSGGGPGPHAHLDPRAPRRQRPQELEVDVAAAVEGELRSRLSMGKTKESRVQLSQPQLAGRSSRDVLF